MIAPRLKSPDRVIDRQSKIENRSPSAQDFCEGKKLLNAKIVNDVTVVIEEKDALKAVEVCADGYCNKEGGYAAPPC